MVGRTARLHNDRAFLLLLEERDQVFPLDLAAYHCVSCGVDGGHLEHRLCSVEANHGNAHRGRSLSGCATTGLWHIDAWGRPPQLRRSSNSKFRFRGWIRWFGSVSGWGDCGTWVASAQGGRMATTVMDWSRCDQSRNLSL